jgi:hypothetical protein
VERGAHWDVTNVTGLSVGRIEDYSMFSICLAFDICGTWCGGQYGA